MNAKAEADSAENLFYVFVCLPDPPIFSIPSFYVVPREVVAKQVREDHRRWLATPRRDGHPHPADCSTRNFGDPDRKYQDRWDLLGLDLPFLRNELDISARPVRATSPQHGQRVSE